MIKSYKGKNKKKSFVLPNFKSIYNTWKNNETIDQVMKIKSRKQMNLSGQNFLQQGNK